MKGILLASHGPLAKGMFETSQLFMGTEIPQYDYLCLEATDAAEDFGAKIKKKAEQLDSGEGVIIFVDLLGGTPYNQSCLLLVNPEKVQLISGMNLSMVLEQLGNRLSDVYDFDALVQTGIDGIKDVNKMFEEM